MIFYFTGTGNSLYAAKHFDKELYSIPQEMKKESRKYTADRIGIVCPLYEFDLPSLVKDFNTVQMLDNALPVFDIEEQRKLDPEKKVDEHLALIKADLDAEKKYIQPASKEEVDFYEGYKVSDKCIGCMSCIHACPQKAIGYAVIQEKNPNARYRHPEISLAEIIQSNNQN